MNSNSQVRVNITSEEQLFLVLHLAYKNRITPAQVVFEKNPSFLEELRNQNIIYHSLADDSSDDLDFSNEMPEDSQLKLSDNDFKEGPKEIIDDRYLAEFYSFSKMMDQLRRKFKDSPCKIKTTDKNIVIVEGSEFERNQIAVTIKETKYKKLPVFPKSFNEVLTICFYKLGGKIAKSHDMYLRGVRSIADRDLYELVLYGTNSSDMELDKILDRILQNIPKVNVLSNFPNSSMNYAEREEIIKYFTKHMDDETRNQLKNNGVIYEFIDICTKNSKNTLISFVSNHSDQNILEKVYKHFEKLKLTTGIITLKFRGSDDITSRVKISNKVTWKELQSNGQLRELIFIGKMKKLAGTVEKLDAQYSSKIEDIKLRIHKKESKEAATFYEIKSDKRLKDCYDNIKKLDQKLEVDVQQIQYPNESAITKPNPQQKPQVTPLKRDHLDEEDSLTIELATALKGSEKVVTDITKTEKFNNTDKINFNPAPQIKQDNLLDLLDVPTYIDIGVPVADATRRWQDYFDCEAVNQSQFLCSNYAPKGKIFKFYNEKLWGNYKTSRINNRTETFRYLNLDSIDGLIQRLATLSPSNELVSKPDDSKDYTLCCLITEEYKNGKNEIIEYYPFYLVRNNIQSQ